MCCTKYFPQKIIKNCFLILSQLSYLKEKLIHRAAKFLIQRGLIYAVKTWINILFLGKINKNFVTFKIK